MNVLHLLRGLAFGDALGAPFETPDGSVHPDLETWDGMLKATPRLALEPGETTDDTAMAYALASSLIERGVYDRRRVWTSYEGMYNRCPNIGWGIILISALQGKKAVLGPELDGYMIGNGALMRSAPLAVLYGVNEPEETWKVVCEDAALTHDHPDVFVATYAYVRAVQRFLFGPGGSLWPAVRKDVAELSKQGVGVARINRVLACLSYDKFIQPPADGSTFSMLTSVYWMTLQASNHMARVGDLPAITDAAIRLGGDTDTRAALVSPFVHLQAPEEVFKQAWDVEDLYTLMKADAGLTGLAMITKARTRKT